MHKFPASFEGLQALIMHLRGPEGCPWDKEQTRASMRQDVLEETYEFLEAIDRGDQGQIMEELGDVLLQMAFQIQIAKDQEEFDEKDVFKFLIDKIVRRHPHVFGDLVITSTQEVLDNWQDLKRQEQSKEEGESMLDGIPQAMPALVQSQSIQQRAASIGFDWNDLGGVIDKIAEEVSELADTKNVEEREREFGDILFTMTNAARWMNVDAEASLRGAAGRFRRRFACMEELGRDRGIELKALDAQAKEMLWQESKRLVDLNSNPEQ